MSSPSAMIPLSLPIPNPTLKDVLSAWKQDVMLSTNCHGIATIQAIRQGSNGHVVVDATMNYSRTYYEKTPTGAYVPKQLAYPQMVDCPLVVLGGGSAAASFPVQQGDACLILFNDRDLNNWFAGAQSGPVASARLHSFADAIALVGFQKLASIETNHAVLTDGNARIGFNTDSDLLTIQNDSESLSGVLTDITGILTSITTVLAGLAGPQPGIVAQIAAANAAIASLLE